MNEDTYVVRALLPSGDYFTARLYNEGDALALARALEPRFDKVKLFLETVEKVTF